MDWTRQSRGLALMGRGLAVASWTSIADLGKGAIPSEGPVWEEEEPGGGKPKSWVTPRRKVFPFPRDSWPYSPSQNSQKFSRPLPLAPGPHPGVGPHAASPWASPRNRKPQPDQCLDPCRDMQGRRGRGERTPRLSRGPLSVGSIHSVSRRWATEARERGA